MENSAGTLIYLFIGYLCGVFFAPDLFSSNIMATKWLNIWTYCWLLGWPIMLAIHFLAPFFIAATAPTTVVIVKP